MVEVKLRKTSCEEELHFKRVREEGYEIKIKERAMIKRGWSNVGEGLMREMKLSNTKTLVVEANDL